MPLSVGTSASIVDVQYRGHGQRHHQSQPQRAYGHQRYAPPPQHYRHTPSRHYGHQRHGYQQHRYYGPRHNHRYYR